MRALRDMHTFMPKLFFFAVPGFRSRCLYNTRKVLVIISDPGFDLVLLLLLVWKIVLEMVLHYT
jgi:hypothetical protein